MTTTLAEIRQAILTQLPGGHLGTASSSSTAAELHDEDDEIIIFSAAGQQSLEGSWILRPEALSADRVRRISKALPDEGVLKPSRAWSTEPDGEVYEIIPPGITPTELDAAINRGLVRLQRLVEEQVTPISRQNTYTLNYPWLVNERQVMEVYQQYTNSGTVTRREWDWWKMTRDDTAFTLRLDPLPMTATGYVIVVEGRSYYDELASDDAETDCPKSWAVAAGMVEVLRQMRRHTQGQDVSRWQMEFSEAKRVLMRESRKYAPRRGRRVMFRTPMPRTSTAPQRGEFYY